VILYHKKETELDLKTKIQISLNVFFFHDYSGLILSVQFRLHEDGERVVVCGIPERVAVVAPHGLHDVVATARPRCRLPAPRPIKLVTVLVLNSVADPDMSDPYGSGPPGS
jgi:hypothetical protein